MKVLWFSRHSMSPEQLAALQAKLGEIEITQIDGTAPNVHVPFEAKCNGFDVATTQPPLKKIVEDFDVVAAVLPINLKQQILPFLGDKPFIEAVNQRMENGTKDGETNYKFVFVKWIQIHKIEVVTSDFV